MMRLAAGIAAGMLLTASVVCFAAAMLIMEAK